MPVTRETVGDATVVRFEGELDLSTSPALRKELQQAIEEGATKVAVDLSETTHVDSSGLATLVQALKELQDKGSLRLFGLTRHVRDVFELARLDRIFDLRDDEAAAVGD